jgi:CRP/FNR family cyclic AMP-dependent transcriptional regulator
MDQKLELLHEVPLFNELDGRGLEEVARLAVETDYPEGHVLMREGEAADQFYVIVDGTVRVEREGWTVRSMVRGGFLGEIALLDHGPRTATATCATDCRMLVIEHSGFDQLMEKYPDIRARVLAALARRIRGTERDNPH